MKQLDKSNSRNIFSAGRKISKETPIEYSEGCLPFAVVGAIKDSAEIISLLGDGIFEREILH